MSNLVEPVAADNRQQHEDTQQQQHQQHKQQQRPTQVLAVRTRQQANPTPGRSAAQQQPSSNSSSEDQEPVVLWRTWAITKTAMALFLSRALGETLTGLVKAPFRTLEERPMLCCQQTQLNRFLVDNMPALKSFSATPWAPGPISQTVLGLALNSGSERYQRRELVQVADGVELLLDWKEPERDEEPLPDNTPVLLLLHGIGGGSDSRLSCMLSDVAKRHGWRCVVFNRRGHGQSSVLPGPQAPLAPFGTPPPTSPPAPSGPGGLAGLGALPFLRSKAQKTSATASPSSAAVTFKVTAAAATATAKLKGILNAIPINHAPAKVNTNAVNANGHAPAAAAAVPGQGANGAAATAAGAAPASAHDSGGGGNTAGPPEGPAPPGAGAGTHSAGLGAAAGAGAGAGAAAAVSQAQVVVDVAEADGSHLGNPAQKQQQIAQQDAAAVAAGPMDADDGQENGDDDEEEEGEQEQDEGEQQPGVEEGAGEQGRAVQQQPGRQPALGPGKMTPSPTKVTQPVPVATTASPAAPTTRSNTGSPAGKTWYAGVYRASHKRRRSTHAIPMVATVAAATTTTTSTADTTAAKHATTPTAAAANGAHRAESPPARRLPDEQAVRRGGALLPPQQQRDVEMGVGSPEVEEVEVAREAARRNGSGSQRAGAHGMPQGLGLGQTARVPRSEASLLKQVSRVFPRHSDTDDLAAVVDFLHAEYPDAPLVALGFSQGSNVLTQYVGQECAKGHKPFVGAMSISNAYDLSLGTRQLASDWVTDAVITRPIKRLLQKELKAVRRLARVHGLQLDLGRAVNALSIREFDEALLVRAFGFESLEDYYEAQSSRHALQDITLPMLLLNNLDDPIIKDALPQLAEEAARANPSLIAARTLRGGHLGWLQGWKGHAWLGDLMMQFAKAAVEAAAQGVPGPSSMQVDAPGPGQGVQAPGTSEPALATTTTAMAL